jgi:hypothetical protein
VTVTPTRTSTATPSPTATPPFPCLGPLTRELAAQGNGQTGATRAATTSGVRLGVYVELTGALPNRRYDVYVDTSGGTAGAHQLIGDFTTNASGNGLFTGTKVVPGAAARIDVELVFHNASAGQHQYIRTLFAPCAE